MRDLMLTTGSLAELMRMPLEPVHQMLPKPELQSILPPPAYNGKPRRFNARQTLLMVMVGDLVRWGVKVPLAGKLVTRLAETLLADPAADTAHIVFHANGASFFTTDEEPDHAPMTGAERFRLTFNLEAYRAVVDQAMVDRARATGADDAE